MNYQRSTNKRFGLRSIIVFMLVLAAMVCCVAVSVFADDATVTPSDIEIGADNQITVSGIRYYTKVYDGTTDVVGSVYLAAGFDRTPFAEHPNVEVAIDTVKLASADAGNTTLNVTFKLVGDAAEVALYSAPTPVAIPAKIAPVQLTWTENLTTAVTVPFDYDTTVYEIDQIGEMTLAEYIKANLTGMLEDDVLVVPEDITVTVEANKPGTYNTAVKVDLGNYVAKDLPIAVTVETPTVKSVDWGTLEFVYGDDAVYAIEVTVTDTAGKKWIVPVSYLEKVDGAWVAVDRISGEKGEYKVYIPAFNDMVNVPAWDDEENGDDVTATLKITHKKYKVTMNDATFVGDSDLTTGENTTKFFVGVTGIGENIPKAVLDQIKYVDEDGNPFTGATAYGETVVRAILPVTDEFSFVNGSGRQITSLTAIITINRLYVSAGTEENKTDVIVMNNGNGFASDAVAEVTLPEFDRNVLRGYPIHTEFTLKLKGVDASELLVLYIPHHESLYSENVKELTADDLYVFDSEKNELVKASEVFTVTMIDGAYRVEGVPAAAEVTFVTAPAYVTPFWLSAPGIALIVMIILVIAVLLFFIGIKSRRAKSTEENAPITVDTVGERYEGKTTLVEGAPAAPRINVDTLTVEVEEEEPVVEDNTEVEERTRGAVADSMQTLADEAMQIILPSEDLTPAEEATNALAQKLSDSLDETVGPDRENVEYDVGEDELKAAVADAIKMAANESADASDAVAVVVEEPAAVEAFAETTESEDDDDDDDDDDALGFSTAGLTFIDVSEEPEAYNEMLEQERAGLVKIVYRYRRSYVSRMTQAQGNVQDYYNAIKNLLLSYKGIKGRISWNYEAFNRGRAHVAKLNAKTKTLYLYLALNPEELVDTKYGIVDMSSKKKYASVPVLMKIKGERKFKYALELIEKLCGEDLALQKLASYEDADFHMAYKSTEELVAEGAMKMYAAAIQMTEGTEG
ncbi:MAG: hypothetical protein IJW16_06430 [Clostridia bacterium]|nr:hypothetical protein [Clostridia bacterium]